MNDSPPLVISGSASREAQRRARRRQGRSERSPYFETPPPRQPKVLLMLAACDESDAKAGLDPLGRQQHRARIAFLQKIPRLLKRSPMHGKNKTMRQRVQVGFATVSKAAVMHERDVAMAKARAEQEKMEAEKRLRQKGLES